MTTHERLAAPTCTSTPSPRTARPTSSRSSTTSCDRGGLDVIAITDHERIDAAVAGRSIAVDRGLPFEVVVGEEVTTLGGHLLALFIERPIKPYRSLRTTIADVHDAGGLAIPAHPLVPYPLCAQGWVLRRLLDDPDPAVHPDALETFNPTALGRPWHDRVVRFAEASWPARGREQRRPRPRCHRRRLDDVRRAGRAADLRAAIEAGTTAHGGTFHGTAGQVGVFGQQLRKKARDARDEVAGRVRRDGTGRDHGYPGRSRPPAALRAAGGPRGGRSMKIGLVCPYIYPENGGVAQHVRFLYENLRLRGHDVRVLTASHGPQRSSEGDIIRLGVGFSVPINASVGTLDLLAALPLADRRDARARAVRRAPLPRAVRAVPVAVPAARIAERQHRDVPRLRRLLAVVRVRQPGACAATRRVSTAASR